jgi:co-chaperonin GroES (HSP10)
VLVQIRRAKTRTASGIIVAPQARGVEQELTQIAKVRALGPVAFKNRDRAEPWPEGEWAKVGEFVRVPQYGGDRWGIQIPGTDEYVTFVVFNDLDLIGRITCDPLSVVAYI